MNLCFGSLDAMRICTNLEWYRRFGEKTQIESLINRIPRRLFYQHNKTAATQF